MKNPPRWKCVFRSSSQKFVEIVVRAHSANCARKRVRIEMAKRFRGKTYKVVERLQQVDS